VSSRVGPTVVACAATLLVACAGRPRLNAAPDEAVTPAATTTAGRPMSPSWHPCRCGCCGLRPQHPGVAAPIVPMPKRARTRATTPLRNLAGSARGVGRCAVLAI